MINQSKTILSENFLLNVDMLLCIESGNAEILFASQDAVMLKEKISGICMIYMKNNLCRDEILNKITPDIEIFECHDEFSYNLLKDKFKFYTELICNNAVYTSEEPLPEINIEPFEIRTIDSSYSEEVIKHYYKDKIAPTDYIHERINSKNMYGIFNKDELCGFIGYHTEGSLGMLEIFDSYRKKGLGTMLETFLVNKSLRDNNKHYIYCQVEVDNTRSINLQKKLNFKISTDKIYWLVK